MLPEEIRNDVLSRDFVSVADFSKEYACLTGGGDMDSHPRGKLLINNRTGLKTSFFFPSLWHRVFTEESI